MRRSLSPTQHRSLMRICSPWAVASIGGLCIGFAILKTGQPRGPAAYAEMPPRIAAFEGLAGDVKAAATNLDYSLGPLRSGTGKLSASATVSAGRAAQSEGTLPAENGAKPALSESVSR
jgi:hypothetical protein